MDALEKFGEPLKKLELLWAALSYAILVLAIIHNSIYAR